MTRIALVQIVCRTKTTVDTDDRVRETERARVSLERSKKTGWAGTCETTQSTLLQHKKLRTSNADFRGKPRARSAIEMEQRRVEDVEIITGILVLIAHMGVAELAMA